MNVFSSVQSFEATSHSVRNLVIRFCSVISFTVRFVLFGLENIPYLPRELSQFL